jgi:uncharacterized RDD family membrane protein YckC
VNTSLPNLSLAGGSGVNDLDNPALYDGVLWRRFWAYAVDALILGAVNLALHAFLIVVTVFTLGLLAPLLAVVSFLTLGVLYDTLMIGGAKSSTPGMRLLGLKALSAVGPAPDRVQAFVMSLLFYVSVSASFGLVLLVPFFTQRSRMIHDLLSGILIARRAGD